MKHMETDALMALLEQAYPNKLFTREPYQVAGANRCAILITHADVAVHDPFLTDCGRFPQDDYYGLTEEHARLMRRHNREYAKYVLGQISDLPFIFDRLVEFVTSQPDVDPTELLDDFGFISWHTGGGCMSYALFNPDGHHILVTDNEGSALPKNMGEAWIGMYDNDESEVRGFFPEPESLPLAERLTQAQSELLTVLGQHPATDQYQALHQAVTEYQCQVKAAVNQWLNDQLPYGTTAKTEDGCTFIFRHGSWTNGQWTFNGLADFEETLKLAIPGDAHLKQGGSKDRRSSAEVVADMAFTAGHLAALNEITVTDSRELMHDIIEWSKQFEAVFSKKRHGEHYIELIDAYASYRLHGDHNNAESVLARMQHQ